VRVGSGPIEPMTLNLTTFGLTATYRK
jgi:hypothetical protein